MLNTQTLKTQSQQMIVGDIDSSTMKTLLFFLYTDHVNVNKLQNGKEIDLFVAADKYQLSELKVLNYIWKVKS
jgi:hypothetical protein